MKVSELFEHDQVRDEPHKIAPHEFDALPEVSPSNVEDRFKVQKVAFDNVKGMGATPNNQNVIYMGFVVEMKPSTFLNLCTDADRGEDAKKFVGFIRKGAPIASPMLFVTCNDDKWEEGKEELKVRVTGHEGRARTWAFDEINGNTPMPVQVFLSNGMRARDLSDRFFEDLRARGFVSQRESASSSPTKVPLGRIFWMEKKV